MVFDNFSSAWLILMLGGFVLAFIMGAIVNKTNFCTMGAVSDWVNMGDTGRFRAWVLAMAVAMIGVVIFEASGLISADGAFPPYRAGNLVWAENLLGGLMFGVGMTLASGCGNKTLIRLGAGNLKSIVVVGIIAVIAYFMINALPGTDKTLFSALFYPWIRPLAIDLGAGQDLGTLLAGTDNAVSARLVIGLLLGGALIFYAVKSADFRRDKDNAVAAIVIGAVILGAWIVSSIIAVDLDGDLYSLRAVFDEWDFLIEDDTVKPALGAPLSPQSFTFINPIGQTLGYTGAGFDNAFLTFGIVSVFGIVLGSLFWAILSKGFRIEWFASFQDFATHVIGAILMGFGGVLGMGCTIGQGITGISTLAIGSFITFIAIVIGSSLTMKIQYYKLVYEEEATFGKALTSALADLKLLPNSLRGLEKV